MPRRSRTRGASGSSKTKRPPVVPPEAQREFEAQLDEIHDSVMSRDTDRLRRVLGDLAIVPSFAPDVITRRMIEGRERAPGIVLAILGDIAQERTPIYLQRIVKAREAPDAVRYEAQRMLGWDALREEKHRVGFLKSLRDPYGALAASTDAVSAIWPARVEALTDVAAYLRALEPPARYEALDRIIEETGWNAIPLLHCLLHAGDPVVQLRAIDGLAALRFSASPGPLRRLVAAADSDEVRQRAEAALRDVSFDRDRSPDDPDEMFPYGGLYPFAWARVTRIDPDGGQSLWVTREVGEGIYESTNVYVSGESGVEEIRRFERLTSDFLGEDLLATEGELAPMTDIALSAARGLVTLAVERSAAVGWPLPWEFELYEPMFHDTYPPVPDETVVLPRLDDAGFADRADLRERGAELLAHPLFTEWALGFDHVLETISRNLEDETAISDEDPDQVMQLLASQLLDAATRQQLREALRGQAWLLDLTGSADERDIALALAIWLPDASDEDLAVNAFVMGLVQESFGVNSSLLDVESLLADFEGLDEDWLAGTDLDGIDPDDGMIEVDWSAIADQVERMSPGR